MPARKAARPRVRPYMGFEEAPFPGVNASWPKVRRYALGFDGYAWWGSTRACARFATAMREPSLNDLRSCLFFEQRRWRHLARTPDRRSMKYIRTLLSRIGSLSRRSPQKRRRRTREASRKGEGG